MTFCPVTFCPICFVKMQNLNCDFSSVTFCPVTFCSTFVIFYHCYCYKFLSLHVNFIIIEIIMSLFLCIYFSYDCTDQHVNGRLN